ncbi:hypothetical protein [Thiomicrorhabdus cannonii]|uniref:hypothetical protein n=1 Tax=Thiomicrorhabdus cannonii TaxID=2748011 RepID=UPI0015BF88E9|nr:hypothetical protein [Thiomicrorhabdus cannonii]
MEKSDLKARKNSQQAGYAGVYPACWVLKRALHEMAARIKMVKNRLIFLDLPLRASSSLFVEKLANSWLLAAFSA